MQLAGYVNELDGDFHKHSFNLRSICFLYIKKTPHLEKTVLDSSESMPFTIFFRKIYNFFFKVTFPS